MTTFLVVLVVLVGAVAVLNLLLTVGVIRRLRQHSERLSTMSAIDAPMGEMVLSAGERVGEFAESTTDGEPVSRELLSGQTLVGVFSPDCGACKEQLPKFVSRAAQFAGGRGQVLAVLTGDAEQVEPYRQQLAPVARVVIEAPMDGPVASALKVQGWPAYAVLDGAGMVVASGFSIDRLPVVTAAGATAVA
jgi:hypothetical protein